MQNEQPQTEHGGTGEPEDPDTLKTGTAEDQPIEDETPEVRNPSGDDLSGALEGDEGNGT